MTNLAGTPAHRLPGSMTVLLSTSAPAATIAPSPMTAWSSTVEPIPIRAPSFIVAPCMVTLCPTETSFPISTTDF